MDSVACYFKKKRAEMDRLRDQGGSTLGDNEGGFAGALHP